MKIIDLIKSIQSNELTSSKALNEKDLLISPLDANVEKSVPFELEKVTFSIGANAGFKIALFNEADDKDPDGIIGGEKPLIPFDPANAWLKYSVDLGLKGGASGNLASSGFEFDLEGEKTLGIDSYRVHKPADPLNKSVIADLSSFRTVFEKNDFAKMDVNEAMTFHVNGKLQGGLVLKWSDIFSRGISLLTSAVSSVSSVEIKIESALKAAISFNLKDDFRLVIVKIDDQKFRLSLKRNKSQTLGASLGASVEVSFADPASLEKIVDGIMESLTGLAKEELNKLLQNPKIDQDKLKKVLDLLQLTGIPDKLKEKYDEYVALVRAKVTSIAEIHAKLSLSYAYSRLSEEEEFFKAVFPLQALEDSHAALLKFKLDSLLKGIQDKSLKDVVIEDYFGEKSIEQNQKWGLALGIGKWSFGGTESIRSKINIIKNLDRHQQVSFTGMRLNESNPGNGKEIWSVDFNADMARFSAIEVPDASEFNYGIHLSWQRQLKKLKNKDKLSSLLDLAVLWKSMKEDEFEGKVNDLYDILKDKNDISFDFNLQSGPGTFRKLIPYMAQRNNAVMAEAMGAAMPYDERFRDRKYISKRKILYGALWKYYLENPKESLESYALTAEKTIAKAGDTNLARLEGQVDGAGEAYSFAGLIKLNVNTAFCVSSLFEGLQILNEGIAFKHHYDRIIAEAFSKLHPFWSQSHHVRSFGAYLLAIRDLSGLTSLQIERTLTVTFPDQDGAIKSVIYTF